MLRNRVSTLCVRAAFGCAWIALPFACAHGVETSLDSPFGSDAATTGVAGSGITVGTSSGPSGSGGAAGSGGADVTATTSTGPGATTTGTGGNTSTTGAGGAAGSAGSTAATGGSGGVGGSSGVGGNGGAGGNAGTGGTAGNGGNAGAGGNGGKAGSGGAGGNAGSGGTGGNAGNGGGGGAMPMPKPTAVTLATTSTPSGQQLTLTTSGTTFSQKCAQNELIIGYTGTVEPPNSPTNWLRSFQAVCASVSIAGTGPYTVNTRQTTLLPPHGMPQSVMLMQMCPANQIIVGFGTRTGGAVDQFTFICAPLVVGGTSPNFTLSIGAQTTLQPLGGPGGTPQTPIQCPAGLVAVGDEGREGDAIEAFGLLCAKPTLVVQ